MAVTTAATNNAVFRKGLTAARAAMMRGEGLAGPLASTGLFPGAARQMFAVGENTGNLDDQLQAAANYLDRELDYRIKRFTTLIEPAVIIAWAGGRLRGHRPGVGHVRDLPPGQGWFVNRGDSDAGFTLVELLVVLVIMPLIVGAIAAAIIVSYQDSGVAGNRISDSSNAQLVSEYFGRDIQGAQYITTSQNAASTPPRLPGMRRCELECRARSGHVSCAGAPCGRALRRVLGGYHGFDFTAGAG